MQADSVPSVYKSTLTQLVANYRSAVPSISICLCSPAQSNRPSAVNDLADYDATVKQLATELSIEFYSMFKSFGSFAVEDALGMWQVDQIHPATPMGQRFAVDFVNRLLKI